MNQLLKIKSVLTLLIGLFIIQSCVQDDDYATPPFICVDELTSNTSIAELLAIGSQTPRLEITDTLIVEGYVVSTDGPGNFYKTISIQNNPSNPTHGIQIELNKLNLANYYPLGSKIKIKLQGLNIGLTNGVVKIGQEYLGGVGQIDENLVAEHVKLASCDSIHTLIPVEYNSIQEVIQSDAINTLIKINNVQFQEYENLTYAENQVSRSRTIEDTNGSTIVLWNSGYADFYDEPLPEGSGSITCVLSKYNSTFQLLIRDIDDVQFNQPRLENDGDSSFSCLNEDFESYAVNNESFANYENLAVQGNRRWRVREFDDNQYIEVSAFQTTGTIHSYFIVPVNFSEADSFSFRTKDGHNNGNALKIYYSTNYSLGGNINNATLVDITSSFTLATGTTSGYAPNFTASGSYNLGSLTGEGVIIFAYEGGNGVTTTFQIDDINIVDSDNPDCEGDIPPPSEGVIFQDGFTNLNNWTAVNITGAQVWGTATFGNPAPSASMNGFSGGAVANEDWLVSNPIAISSSYTSVTFSFETDGMYNGNPLEVYYTTNYTGNVATTSWTQLNPALDTNLSAWGAWTNSGNLNVSSAIGGNLVIAFKYTSTSSAATHWQVDNVLVTAN